MITSSYKVVEGFLGFVEMLTRRPHKTVLREKKHCIRNIIRLLHFKIDGGGRPRRGVEPGGRDFTNCLLVILKCSFQRYYEPAWITIYLTNENDLCRLGCFYFDHG